ncbi:MAG: MFS transporter [Verrucomicrobiota bacterium]
MQNRFNYPLVLISQFLGAFGDQMFLWLIIGPLTAQQKQGVITEQHVNSANAFYACMFYAAYVVLAPAAGFLNDRFPKTRWLFGGNVIKIIGVLVGSVSLTSSGPWQAAGYFLIGVGACVFSPAKYGVLPEILPAERLVKANGTVEMLTIVAILTGIIFGAWMTDHYSAGVGYSAVFIVYALSLVLTLFMSKTPCNPDICVRASIREFSQHAMSLFRHPRLSRMLLGTGLFWVSGSVMKSNFQSWGLRELGLTSNTKVSLLSLWLAVGIIGGSMIVGHLHKIGDLRAVRIYGWVMALFIAALGFVHQATPELLTITGLIITGVFGGLFLIPLNAALQCESDPHKLGKTIAVQNLIDNLSMIIGGGCVILLSNLGSTASVNFMALALVSAVIIALLKMPALKPANVTNQS